MDLFGPIATPSLNGSVYTLVMVDELSKYTWVIFLKTKSEPNIEIINLIRKLEVLQEKKVKELRS